MTKSVFRDVAAFNNACGTEIGGPLGRSSKLYRKLFAEKVQKVADAIVLLDQAADPVKLVEATAELADGLLDTVYIAIGWMRAMGLDPQPLWDEVQRSNMAKVDPETGKVTKREDGKVLKPADWTPPDLKSLVAKQLGYVKRAGADLDGQILEHAKVAEETARVDGQATIIEPSYTVEQAAFRAGMSSSWIREQVRDGKLRAVKRGAKAIRIPQSALAELLAAPAAEVAA